VLENASEGDLWVRTGVRGDKLAVEFADSGPGVKEPSRVFDPFYTTKPVGKGTGLGLSICYGIITEHGGTITVCNVQPHGAAFMIELPFQAAAPARTPGTQRLQAAIREGRILLVDEDHSVLDVVGTIGTTAWWVQAR
jgi:two-component system NtrC family sensor kinase